MDVEEGVMMDPSKVEVITSWKAPSNVREVRSFLGFSNFYRGFIRNFASISNPLQTLTKKGTAFHWNEQHQTSSDTLKRLFITAPILQMW